MSSLAPGTTVGRYRVIRLLAQGGMAEVYRAEQALAAGILRPVALKVIRPEYAQSEDFREMFLDEARTACTLSHPHIVPIHEVGDEGGLLYMAMELVPGESLAGVAHALWARGERFPDEALLAVGIATCSALEAVHARPRLVHRDVSPQNLLLTPGGTLKLIDFGIAKAASNRNLTRVGTTKGKAGYFSPEQAQGKPLDGRSDLFSLGITLYHLAAGVGPLDGHDSLRSRHSALLRGDWAPLSRVCPDLTPGLLAAVERAMRVKPEERPATARALREELEAAAVAAGLAVGPGALAGYVQEEGEGVTAVKPRPRRTRVGATGASPSVTALRTFVGRFPGDRRVWLSVAGVGMALVLSLVGAAVFLRSKTPAPLPAPASPENVPPPPARPVTQPVAEPPVASAPTPPPIVIPPPEVPPEPLTPPVLAAPERPKRDPKRSREPLPPRETVAAAPAPPEEVLEGEGELRLGVVEALKGKVTVLLPGGQREEVPHSQRHMKAGRYALTFSSPEGPVRCDVKVLPDKRLLVVFDGRSCKVTSY